MVLIKHTKFGFSKECSLVSIPEKREKIVNVCQAFVLRKSLSFDTVVCVALPVSHSRLVYKE